MDHFKVRGRVNGSDGTTMHVDRERGLVIVRPKGERRGKGWLGYVLPLQVVAEMVVCRVVKNELAVRG